jgi:hypothetical protein
MQSIEIDADDEYAMEERDKVRVDTGNGRQ